MRNRKKLKLSEQFKEYLESWNLATDTMQMESIERITKQLKEDVTCALEEHSLDVTDILKSMKSEYIEIAFSCGALSLIRFLTESNVNLPGPVDKEADDDGSLEMARYNAFEDIYNQFIEAIGLADHYKLDDGDPFEPEFSKLLGEP